MIQPALTVLEQDAKYGPDLYKVDPDQCCYMRKLVPLANLLQDKYAWITSIRREQTEYRASAQAFEYDSKFKLGKINPLIHWTKSNVWKFVHENNIPYNNLLDQGYDSIGCEPCTSPGEGRKGRWAGKDKIECGLHIQDSEMKQGGEFTI
jgi:phosphoadenosine phosphosulfate reductase